MMLKPEELQLAKINPLVAREAFDHASKRLADILDTRKSYEQKAFTLFSGYLTAALGLFAAGVALVNTDKPLHAVLTVWVAGAVFVIGAFMLLQALLDQAYGAMGSDPELWLRAGVIDGDDAALPLMLAYLTHRYQGMIDGSALANSNKARWIRTGVFVGVLAPLVTGASFFLLRSLGDDRLKALF